MQGSSGPDNNKGAGGVEEGGDSRDFFANEIGEEIKNNGCNEGVDESGGESDASRVAVEKSENRNPNVVNERAKVEPAETSRRSNQREMMCLYAIPGN